MTKVLRVCLLTLILCGILSQGRPYNLSINSKASTAGIAQFASEPLTPGEPKAGSLPAVEQGSDPVLGPTQYTVQYPGGGVKLVLEFRADYPMNFFVRRNLPVTIEEKNVLADFGPFFGGTLSLPRKLPIDAATYYIAVRNFSPRVVNFTLTANLLGPPTADTVDFSLPTLGLGDKIEVGSIPTAAPTMCALGRTQYTISLADSVYCSVPTGWNVSLFGDQPLKLYARLGQRVTVANGTVVADTSSNSSNGGGFFFQSISGAAAPGVRTFFIAVENCSPNTANYVLSFGPFVGDLPAPSINWVSLEGKKLHVNGYFLNLASVVLINGEPQATKYGGRVYDRFFAEDILIVKNARKKIPLGEIVTINVDTRSGCITYPFLFIRRDE